ncbi:GTPase Der [Fusobacterium sp. DD29]|uniref:[FeFe] hydrogenase H-cluster maturation GTPase HydF n=1 Tax=unclassified Fusobacterium TaxID=2648384 RepID=UPI001B8B346D|nr:MULTISPECIES: [FeFe] hydrogenase H-cluster maturation GTPase HydF [unclassified Fusobacterium]MBR8702005.1 GTPase Der [Fusobacterium sp. DD45]MBR8711803.1 GTPase Der [Fusobacterium sp. DD28]MBR8750227.1 GTPase Der [Fusobacterium sp. DD29]MBR8752368.1 GTPase Der [Fusobacterium sp. DD26]MBR8762468.1 GTPase Der [Fusobacterium sp. DD25]
MIETPRGNRVHIALFGRTNAGKSSLVNKITNQNISLVSDVRGTTTDPVYKAMELLPIGPVVFIDTAGIDDDTQIGALRIEKTLEVLNKMDVGLLIISAKDIIENRPLDFEKEWLDKIKKKNKPYIVVINKTDLVVDRDKFEKAVEETKKNWDTEIIPISSLKGEDIQLLKKKIIELAPKLVTEETLIGDKINQGDKILLVAPQDIQAPKGRLILPQVQVIRDILDNGGIPTVVTLGNLKNGLNIFDGKPDLVITDSQVFAKVDEVLDKNIPLTSFSIIMARAKGDLEIFYRGAKRINTLKAGDKVLIAEACTHHQMKGDIAREKIPMLLEKKVPGIIIDNCSGKDFPKNLDEYSLVIHCGSCMLNRAETMSRVENCEENRVGITNFGMTIAELNGILDRVTEIFNLKI